jgi:16S rRNA (cytosine1402-N4)-methyltransferase
MVEEAVAGLSVRAEGKYVDATFGRGGHSRAILAKLGPRGRLLALDRDPAAVMAAEALGDARLTIRHAPFSTLAAVAGDAGFDALDGVLLDLGVSTPQLEEAARGFSFRRDGPLDMRMDTTRGMTAAQWLNEATEQELEEVIDAYGEERFAKRIARAIVASRAQQPLATTRQLGVLVAKAVGTREPGQDPATRTFQAVRIFVNQELAELTAALPQAISLLAPGGRVAVISFHSLEDRIVKRCFQDAEQPGRDPALAKLPIRARDLPQPILRRVGRAIRPGPLEVERNPRARSAVLRIAERTEAPLPPRFPGNWGPGPQLLRIGGLAPDSRQPRARSRGASHKRSKTH